jgi:hypothetical protein
LGTFCGNTVGTRKDPKNPAPFPPSPKGKKLVTLGVCWLIHWQPRNSIPLCGNSMDEGKNCAFMSGNGLHIVLAEPMFSIN